MSDEEWLELALNQYRRVPALIGRPYDPDTGLQVLNHLLDRDEMEQHREFRADLEAGDDELIAALAEADPAWWEKLERWATECGFSSSLWWITVWYRARRRSDRDAVLADVLGGHVDG
ncbi:MAG: hypothetical protein ACOCX2_08225 [Armatimonadota bacterium]